MEEVKFLVDNATEFHKSLTELRDFSSQLYHAADYWETAFLSSQDKRLFSSGVCSLDKDFNNSWKYARICGIRGIIPRFAELGEEFQEFARNNLKNLQNQGKNDKNSQSWRKNFKNLRN
ncbi:UNVERIFIED_CONTAM: hypothetical protein Sangu_1427100 [Sesamum angustifolium]|uniref:Uncharacterized protein n=1 Tax=Sesamum angustifolium TaxID=2727405 RepID=A0AAW2N6D7_9LAMI